MLNKTDDVKLSEEWHTFEEHCAHELWDTSRVRAIPDLHQQENLQPASKEDTTQPYCSIRPTEIQGSGSAVRNCGLQSEETEHFNTIKSPLRLTSDLSD